MTIVQQKADDFYFEIFADGVRHFKETAEGRDDMGEAFEKLANKVADARAEQVAKQLAEQVAAKTKVELLVSLVSDGLLEVNIAAKRCNMTVDDFSKLLDAD